MFELLTGMGIGILALRLLQHLRRPPARPAYRWTPGSYVPGECEIPPELVPVQDPPPEPAPRVVQLQIPMCHLHTIGFRSGILCPCGAVGAVKWRNADRLELVCPQCGPRELFTITARRAQKTA